MLDLSPEKLLLLGVIAFVVLGPNRLPGVARTAGRWVADLRRTTGSLQAEVRDALAEPHQALTSAAAEIGLADLRPGQLRRRLRDSVTGVIMAPPGVPGASGATAVSTPDVPAAPDDPSLN